MVEPVAMSRVDALATVVVPRKSSYTVAPGELFHVAFRALVRVPWEAATPVGGDGGIPPESTELTSLVVVKL